MKNKPGNVDGPVGPYEEQANEDVGAPSKRLRMTKTNKQPLLPKLRFPEFEDDGIWEYIPLGREASILKEKAGDKKYPVMSVETGVGLVSQLEKFGRDISGKSYKNYIVIQKDDFAYNKSATKVFPEGFIAKHKGENQAAVPNSIFTCFRIKAGMIHSDCLYFLFLGNLHGKWLRKFITVGARAHGALSVNTDDLMNLPVPVPTGDSSFNEQQKIAECLGSLDELIAAHIARFAALQAHKKGLLQQLFPAEGQTTPNLRFPEFQNAGKWKEKRVDERGEVLAGKALAVNAPGQLRPYLRTKNVYDGTIDLSDVRKMPMTDAEFNRFEILDGDILLNEGQSLEFVGRTATYRGEFEGRCAMQNQLLRFRAFPSTCTEFAAQAFRKYQKDGTFANIATKTTSVAHLGCSRFSSLKLAWPTLPEQQRIADCLSSLDGLITAQAEQIAALKEHKKGLMQQLFPNPELSKK